jgi:hypothetical protein
MRQVQSMTSGDIAVPSTTGSSRRGMAASERLTRALLQLTAQGLRPHCDDTQLGWLWLSETPSERAVAVVLCGGCPVKAPCRAAAEANQERFGVFGGKDYTRRPGKKKVPL